MTIVDNLSDMVAAVHSGAPPAWLRIPAAREATRHYGEMQSAFDEDSAPVYGANTMLGHRDHIRMPESEVQYFQRYILDHHALGGDEYHSTWQAGCISAAKACQAAAGGLMLSPRTYRAVIEAGFASDFQPRVAKADTCSYSSGDVIPGAHWARDLLEYAGIQKLGPGEALALINGSFVHVGLALAAYPAMLRLHALNLRASALQAYVLEANPFMAGIDESTQAFAAYAGRLGLQTTHNGGKNRQFPVSIRAIPQTIDALNKQLAGFQSAVHRHLHRPSGNPLWSGDGLPTSQASFLAPDLVFAQMSAGEACLFTAWHSLSRMQFLISGKVPGIPLDGVSKYNRSLGFIQLPKLASALLQKGRRMLDGYSISHAITPHDQIEDLWTGGSQVSCQVDNAVAYLHQVVGLEVLVAEHFVCARNPDYHALINPSEKFLNSGAAVREALNTLDNLELTYPSSPERDYLQDAS